MKEDNMEQTLTLLVMLAGVSHAAQTKFNGTQKTSLFSLTPGGSVSIQVINNASGHQVLCKKQLPTGLVNVFTMRKEKVTISEDFKNRMQFFINNGTLEITNAVRNDSGQYSVEAFDSDGHLVRNFNFQLDVQEHMLSSILIPTFVGVAALILLAVVCICVCKRKKTSGSSI